MNYACTKEDLEDDDSEDYRIRPITARIFKGLQEVTQKRLQI